MIHKYLKDYNNFIEEREKQLVPEIMNLVTLYNHKNELINAHTKIDVYIGYNYKIYNTSESSMRVALRNIAKHRSSITKATIKSFCEKIKDIKQPLFIKTVGDKIEHIIIYDTDYIKHLHDHAINSDKTSFALIFNSEGEYRSNVQLVSDLIRYVNVKIGFPPDFYTRYLSPQGLIGAICRYCRASVEKKNNFVLKCPNAECVGYVNELNVCLVCNKEFCRSCFKELVDDHECNEDDVKTFKDILKNTKPCPKCGERIFKNGGCSQMFCTLCHCCFDWNTGQLITKYFHNPHHEEWIRNNRHLINEGDNPCEITNIINNFMKLINIKRTEILHESDRDIQECSDVHIDDEYVHLRLLYVLKLIDYDKYHKKIVKITNRNSYVKVVHSVLTQWSQILLDILQFQHRYEIEQGYDEINKRFVLPYDMSLSFEEMREHFISSYSTVKDKKKAEDFMNYKWTDNLDAIRLIIEETEYTHDILKNIAKGWYNRTPKWVFDIEYLKKEIEYCKESRVNHYRII
jgi:hypothetical protein